MRNFRRIEALTFLVITLVGIANGAVTVFYLIYLFWFQELVRTTIDFFLLFSRKETFRERLAFVQESFGSFFLLFIYFIFIVVLFGFMLNWNDQASLGSNVRVLMFRNWYFNTTVLLFLAEYLFFRVHTGHAGVQLRIFNRRHIILHISIILGAFVQLAFIPNYAIDGKWGAALVALPFVVLKIVLDGVGKQITDGK